MQRKHNKHNYEEHSNRSDRSDGVGDAGGDVGVGDDRLGGSAVGPQGIRGPPRVRGGIGPVRRTQLLGVEQPRRLHNGINNWIPPEFSGGPELGAGSQERRFPVVHVPGRNRIVRRVDRD